VDTVDMGSAGDQPTDRSFRDNYPVGPQGTFGPNYLQPLDNLAVAAAATCVAAVVPATIHNRIKPLFSTKDRLFDFKKEKIYILQQNLSKNVQSN